MFFMQKRTVQSAFHWLYRFLFRNHALNCIDLWAKLVETKRIELSTPRLRTWCSPSWATSPLAVTNNIIALFAQWFKSEKKVFCGIFMAGDRERKEMRQEKRIFFDYIGNYAFIKIIIGILTYKLNTARLLATIVFSVRRFWFKY